MASDYYFSLNDGGVTLKLIDELGPLNTWSSTGGSNDCLVVNAGFVDNTSNPNALVCHSGPPRNEPVITLHGAAWDSNVGATGRAEGHLVVGCNPTQWSLIRKE